MRKLFSVFSAALIAVCFVGCDVDVEDRGELPEVEVEGGEAPQIDVTGPEVDAEMETTTVEVPDVDVDVPEEDEQ